ncbi:MAG: diguanylate cyclase [Candidatus Hydrogenedentota bacterium]
MHNRERILLIDDDPATAATAAHALADARYRIDTAPDADTALATLYQIPPQCLVVSAAFTAIEGGTLLAEIKADNLYGHLPALLLLDRAQLAQGVDWAAVPADDYLVRPVVPEDLAARVALSLTRAQRDVNANPLTGLPGNVSLMREAERRLAAGKRFAMAYLDIDHFKSFNDKYGFSRGDEVLRMTARILTNALRALHIPDAYLGHVGGDDFVFLIPPASIARACKEVLRNFDLIVPNFYDDDDRERGSIEAHDRQGAVQSFPLLSCSIAVVMAGPGHASHLGDIAARAANVKHFAKSVPGSNFLLDRRQ